MIIPILFLFLVKALIVLNDIIIQYRSVPVCTGFTVLECQVKTLQVKAIEFTG